MDAVRIDHIPTDTLRQEWMEMTAASRQSVWDRFTRDIDEGAAGWNRFRPLLWPAYKLGQAINLLTPD